MTDELKPCPFCGSTGCGHRSAGCNPEAYQATCNECGASGPFVRMDLPPNGKERWPDMKSYLGAIDETIDKAIAAWNRRAGGWVSVEERLPEDGQWAVVAMGKLDHPLVSQFKTGWGNDGWAYPNVHHWKPLPEPPE